MSFAYLQQNAFDKEDAYCPLKRQIELFELIQTIFETRFSISIPTMRRASFFLNLQNEIKNMNFLPFGSEKYKRALAAY